MPIEPNASQSVYQLYTTSMNGMLVWLHHTMLPTFATWINDLNKIPVLHHLVIANGRFCHGITLCYMLSHRVESLKNNWRTHRSDDADLIELTWTRIHCFLAAVLRIWKVEQKHLDSSKLLKPQLVCKQVWVLSPAHLPRRPLTHYLPWTYLYFWFMTAKVGV